MALQLSARLEREPYKYFADARAVDLMPKLIKEGYLPASVAVLVDRRQHAPEDVRGKYLNLKALFMLR